MDEILKPEQLIPIAVRQGLPLNEAEAYLLLGYMEGHDYVLLSDAQGRMARHDLQMDDDHSEDAPYSIVETLQFVREMNEDLLCDAERWRETDKEYLNQLREDDRRLAEIVERLPVGVYI